jgi:hypothetical protein
VNDATRAALIALYAAICAVLSLPLPEGTRRSLRGSKYQLARDLDLPITKL